MKKYLITEDQKKALEAHLKELPIKYFDFIKGPLNLLANLTELKEDSKEESKEL